MRYLLSFEIETDADPSDLLERLLAATMDQRFVGLDEDTVTVKEIR